jgi:hypothetical protein
LTAALSRWIEAVEFAETPVNLGDDIGSASAITVLLSNIFCGEKRLECCTQSGSCWDVGCAVEKHLRTVEHFNDVIVREQHAEVLVASGCGNVAAFKRRQGIVHHLAEDWSGEIAQWSGQCSRELPVKELVLLISHRRWQEVFRLLRSLRAKETTLGAWLLPSGARFGSGKNVRRDVH